MFGRLVVLMVFTGLLIGFAVPMGTRVVESTPAKPQSVAAVVAAKPQPPTETVLERESDGHFYAYVEVNGQTVRFLIDTGASTVALTKDDAQRVGIPFSPSEFRVVGRGASGPAMGQLVTIGRVAIDGKQAYDVQGVVLDDGLDISLLGQSFLSKIPNVTIQGDRMTLR